MLTDKGFVRWARERLVVCVAHNELGHDEVEGKDEAGRPVPRCTLYPGLRCRDHLGISVDIDNARADGLIKVPFIELCPNSWIVSPTGTVTQIPEEDQFDEKKIRERVETLQKELGPDLGEERYRKVLAVWEKVQPAIDEDRWRDALTLLASVEKEAKEPQAPLEALISAHLTSIDEVVVFAFEEARDDEKTPLEERKAAVKKLVEDLDVPVLGRRLPVVDAMKSWLAGS